MHKILIVDDQKIIIEHISKTLKEKYSLASAQSGTECLAHMESFSPDVVLLDIILPDGSGIDILKEIKKISPDTIVIIITGLTDISYAVEAMKFGAYDYLTKPIDSNRMTIEIHNALEQFNLSRKVTNLKTENKNKTLFSNIIHQSRIMRELISRTALVAAKDVNTIIYGESGTGKELLAEAIHKSSSRTKGPFIKVNCATITLDLAESLLFGHKRGAFTGAISDHAGYFEQANGGTLFLDEIGELNPEIQAKFLRVLETKSFGRVGDTQTRSADFRIISATNRNLKDEVTAHAFREDLYYRLEEFPLTLPPLRERREDIPLLAEHFLYSFSVFYEVDRLGLSNNAIRELIDYDWPGNIRELKNVIHRTAIQCTSDTIESFDLTKDEKKQTEVEHKSGNFLSDTDVIPLEILERNEIEKAYRVTEGNVDKAALLLGIGRATLYRKLKTYGLIS